MNTNISIYSAVSILLTSVPSTFIIQILTSTGSSVLIPITGRGGPYGCETSRLPHFLHNQFTDGGEVVSLKRRPPFPLGRFLVLISVRNWVVLRAIVRLEGLGKFGKFNDIIGNRTRDLRASSKVPQANYATAYPPNSGSPRSKSRPGPRPSW
jgi:hypothetical protein